MIETDIKAIIEKNLPAQVGDVLKQRLLQADVDAQTVKQQIALLKDRDNKINELNTEISSYKQFDTRNSALDAREEEISEKERDIKASTLEYQLAAEKDKTSFTKSIALGLVRNTTYRKNVFDSENQSGYSTPQGWVNPSPINKSLTETKEMD